MRLASVVADARLGAAGVAVRGLQGDLAATEVESMTLDSQAVAPGALYCCVLGQRFDGHDFAPQAIRAGAVAVLGERALDLPVPQIVVDDVRASLGPLSDALHGHPSQHLTVVGVTGTNGKTTTTHLLAAIFGAAGWPTATIGTLSGARTTPEAPLLQATLARFRRDGIAAVAMEVSSHALVQHRVDAITFAAAVFTNLSQDHLDYHKSMEDYFDAKARLFEPGRATVAVVNADDPWGQALLARMAAEDGRGGGSRRVVTFSLGDAAGLEMGSGGSRFRWRGGDLMLRLGGRFNVRNALAAATAAEALGVDRRAIAEGLATVDAVRGRFEAIRLGQPFTVLVDYAHTPDGLEQALRSARELAGGRLLVVFGAGGDRDRAKRPLMGQVAAGLADLVVVTSDNPRGEDPLQIISEVLAGAAGPARIEVEPDRARAIHSALGDAGPGDVVLIAGKGHETMQELADGARVFDDAEVAREALATIGRQRGAW